MTKNEKNGWTAVIGVAAIIIGSILSAPNNASAMGGGRTFSETPLWLIGLRMFLSVGGLAMLVMGVAGMISAFVKRKK